MFLDFIISVTKIKRTNHNRLATHFISLSFIIGMCLSHSSNAALLNVFVSTKKDTPIPIDLRASITNIQNPDIRVGQGASHGSAQTSICSDGGSTCIEYSPNPGYEGYDTFTYYDVSDRAVVASVTVQVGNVVTAQQGLVAAEQYKSLFVSNCSVDQNIDLSDFCQPFYTIQATPGELLQDERELFDAIAPQDVASQGTVGNTLAEQQLKNIGKHLAALRSGQVMASTGGLTFYQGEKAITGKMLAEWLGDNDRGGAASADNVKGRWGWFVNGNIGKGKQQESEYESGFDFSSQGVSAGLDYRFGSIGYTGLAIGGANSELELEFSQGNMDVTSSSILYYASFYPTQKSFVDFILAQNKNEFDSKRYIQAGQWQGYANSKPKGTSNSVKLAAGMEVVNIRGFNANIQFSAQTIRNHIDEFSESGITPYNVTVQARDITQTTASLGTTLSYAVSFSSGVWIPQLDVFIVHQFEQDADRVVASFVDYPELGETPFDTNQPDTTYMQVDAGFSVVTVNGHTGFLQLGASAARDRYQALQLAVGYRIDF